VAHGKPAIVAEGFEKHYGEVRALCGLSFAVGEGTVLGALGPNGAGKTPDGRRSPATTSSGRATRSAPGSG
jgi:ABC-2 type transport system ATP-binding protein